MGVGLIWVLLGGKGGDNAQAINLAKALRCSFITKKLALKAEFEIAKPRISASLHPFELGLSDPLAPPWPDLLLTVGRRLSIPRLRGYSVRGVDIADREGHTPSE